MYTSTLPSSIQHAESTSYCADGKNPFPVPAGMEHPLASTNTLHSIMPLFVSTLTYASLTTNDLALHISIISAPFLLACFATCLSSALLSIAITFLLSASILMVVSSTLIVAYFILLSNLYSSIPNELSASTLTKPPQCSGVPISASSSNTRTENPLPAISLAARSPDMLPPITITSYISIGKIGKDDIPIYLRLSN